MICSSLTSVLVFEETQVVGGIEGVLLRRYWAVLVPDNRTEVDGETDRLVDDEFKELFDTLVVTVGILLDILSVQIKRKEREKSRGK